MLARVSYRARTHTYDDQVRPSGAGVEEEEFRIESSLTPPRWLLISASHIDHDGFTWGSGYGTVLCCVVVRCWKIRLVFDSGSGTAPISDRKPTHPSFQWLPAARSKFRVILPPPPPLVLPHSDDPIHSFRYLSHLRRAFKTPLPFLHLSSI